MILRELYPEVNDRFSWFDYRSRGFEHNPKRGLRIDHIWVTKPLRNLPNRRKKLAKNFFYSGCDSHCW